MPNFLAFPRILISAQSLNEAAHFLEKALSTKNIDYLIADGQDVLGTPTTCISLENYYEDAHAFGLQINDIWRNHDEYKSSTPLYYYTWDTIQDSLNAYINANILKFDDPVMDDPELLVELNSYLSEHLKKDVFSFLENNFDHIDEIGTAISEFCLKNQKLIHDLIAYKTNNPFNNYESSFAYAFKANDRFLCFPRLLIQAENQEEAIAQIAQLKGVSHIEDILLKDKNGDLVKKSKLTSFDEIEHKYSLMFTSLNDGLRNDDETAPTTKPHFHHWSDISDKLISTIESDFYDDAVSDQQDEAISQVLNDIQDNLIHHLGSYDGFPDLAGAIKDFIDGEHIGDLLAQKESSLENDRLNETIINHAEIDPSLKF